MGSFNQILDDKATCRDMFEYFFDLSPNDVGVLYSLNQKTQECLDDITSRIQKDRTTVFRSLQRLIGAGLVMRKKNVMEKGGYYYVYSRISSGKISDLVNQKEQEFHMVLQCLLKGIDSELKN
jgi:predicted transcriptional regulator